MKAFFGVKYHKDEKNKDKINSIISALEKLNLEVVCLTTKDYGKSNETPAQELMEEAFEEIRASDLVIIELTEKGVGLGIEAGYARSNDIPVYTIAEKGSDVSKTLKGISERVIMYKDPMDLVEKLTI